MGREEEIVKKKEETIAELRKTGINPYPYSFEKTASSEELKKKYEKLKPDTKTKDKASIAGRVMAVRDMGKINFFTLQDDKGKMQVIVQEKESPEKTIEIFRKFVDSGDFIGVSGVVARTKRGEISILAREIEILSKSILPLPEKWHGLQDKEERYRKRYLDLIMNPEVKEVFVKREKITDAIRELLKGKGFIEVDTPYLQTIYGGAEARPFKTHLHALDTDLFLAISPELYLKRLVVGGFEKVFTIARNFRNEGIDATHNPEFTMMEIYQAYVDYNEMMELFEEIYEYVCKKVFGTTKLEYQGKTLDFKKPWKRMTMAEAIKKYAGINVLKMSAKELGDFSEKNHVEYKEKSWGMLVANIFEHFCEKELIQPTFITDHPKETTPLCKVHRKDARLIERFEPFCMGMELGNAYSELNDAKVQEELFKEQEEKLKRGEEAHPHDKDFVEALKYGMPPTGGLGLGIDRMLMLLCNQPSIRDVILFPFMRPEKTGEEEKKAEK
jgi:lysyl-tRNA synthetase class 2